MGRVFASIGECMVELSQTEPGHYRRGFAGDTFNTAWTLRALARPEDLAVRYVSAVGTDQLSDDMVAFMAEAGIDTRSIHRVPERTVGLYMISLQGAERSFTYWRDRSAARLLASEESDFASWLADADHAYFSGITLAILSREDRDCLLAALQGVAARGGTVVFDPNHRPRLWSGPATARAAFEEACRAATVVLPTFPDEAELFGDRSPEATADRIAGYGVGEIVVKNGSEPCLIADGDARSLVPGVRVERPVDTTGAGDAFNAGYLAGRMKGLGPEAAARLGHRTAARIIQVRGALADPRLLSDLLM
jgi:2-dehydro-3-deoxygluconokinase